MKAAVLQDFGSVDNFSIEDVSLPSIHDEEVLIQTKAVGINPVETVIRAGKAFTEAYENLDYKILGWDVSGIVSKAGPNVKHLKEGDEVFGMVKFPDPAFAYAEYLTAPESDLALKPDDPTHEETAGATLAALTAYQGLIHHAGIRPGQKVLILAAGGGVGHYAVQIAKAYGCRVIGVASAEKRDFVRKCGADEHIDYKTRKFEDVVTDADVVLDGVGGEHSYRALNALKKGGIVISLLAIATDLPDKAAIQGKQGQIMMVQPSGKDMTQIAELLGAGKLKTHITETYPLEQIGRAHMHLENGKTQGKVVITFA